MASHVPQLRVTRGDDGDDLRDHPGWTLSGWRALPLGVLCLVAARHRIVEGAVGMVELALDRLSEDAVIERDEERRATMVGNLLVVLCSDRDPQPVVNSGTLY